MPPRSFCSQFSQQAREEAAGTGAHPARMILILWPKGRWMHPMSQARDMAPPLSEAIARVRAAGWRVNLIDRKTGPAPQGQAMVFPEGLHYATTPETLPALLDALGAEAPAPLAATPISAPPILCCTHGVHDACCAKFGHATYRALEAAAQTSGAPVEIWETTHLGGCRFSPNVLVVGAMRKYGRVMPRDAAPLLAAEGAGRAYLPCLRGSAHLSPAAQVAEIAALRHHAAPGETAAPAQRVDQLHLSAGQARFRVETAQGRVEVTCTEVTVDSHDSCADLMAEEGLKSRRQWRLAGLRALT